MLTLIPVVAIIIIAGTCLCRRLYRKVMAEKLMEGMPQSFKIDKLYISVNNKEDEIISICDLSKLDEGIAMLVYNFPIKYYLDFIEKMGIKYIGEDSVLVEAEDKEVYWKIVDGIVVWTWR